MRIPAAGEVAWVDFDPAIGHEQAGLRPAVVISPLSYNENSSFIIVCPITGNTREWPWKVALPPVAGFYGCVLVDQIKSVDQRRRVRRLAGRVSEEALAEVRRLIQVLLDSGA